MWETISVLIDFGCLVVVAVIWARMAIAHRRAGTRVFATTPLSQLPSAVRRQLMRTIRHGDAVPVEYRGVARRWAHYEFMRRGILWTAPFGIVFLANGLPALARDPSPWYSVAGFWLAAFGLCLMIGSTVLLWRDQRAALRVLRDTPPVF